MSVNTIPARSRRLRRAVAGGEAGAVSAEYAVATVAACGFAGILFKIISSPQVLQLMSDLFAKALSWMF